MGKSILARHVTVRQGAYLPHWTLTGATYAVCFRLADSLPQPVVEAWQRERAALLDEARATGCALTPVQQDRLRELFSDRVERFLDAGRGGCALRRPEIASCVVGALRHFDGMRHRLAAWCVMPNHVHAVVEPMADHTLSVILKSWKGYSGKEANRLLRVAGEFWQPESYDHLIRDEADFVRSVHYVLENPAKAGLANGPWVWGSDDAKARVEKWRGPPDL